MTLFLWVSLLLVGVYVFTWRYAYGEGHRDGHLCERLGVHNIPDVDELH